MVLKSFSSLAKDNGKLAVMQCLKLLGQKNCESIIKGDDGVYLHTNSRGIKRRLLPCMNYNQYKKEHDKRPNAKLHKCLGYYVLYWKED